MSALGAQTLPARLAGYISKHDSRIMRRVHRWPAPRWLRVFMIAATRGGDGWLWYGVGALLLTFGGPQRRVAVATAGLSSAVGLAVYLVMKRATRRKRPCTLEPHCWARLVPPEPLKPGLAREMPLPELTLQLPRSPLLGTYAVVSEEPTSQAESQPITRIPWF